MPDFPYSREKRGGGGDDGELNRESGELATRDAMLSEGPAVSVATGDSLY